MSISSIADKTYFKIGEVAAYADIKTSVLRFWETEFTFLNPEKSASGQRLYTKQDIELVLQIKQLLYKEKYTIEGVRNKLLPRKGRVIQAGKAQVVDMPHLDILKQVKHDLLALRAAM
jgi:DNA-binding transcriptional MerR regulator